MSEPRRPLSWLLLGLLLLVVVAPAGDLPAQDSAVILHLNDLHGQVHPRRRSSGDLEGGFRGLAAMVEAERTKSGEDRVLLLDAGDWFQGTPEGNLSKGRFIIDLFNAIALDATVIGNHDFDFGVENLRELVARAKFPVLGANILEPDRSGPVPWALQTTVIERGGIRFGLVGVVTEDTKRIVRSEVARDLQFADAVESVRTGVEELRAAGAECIVVLCHLGVVPERALAAAVPGIDLIVGGHSHTLVEVPWVEPTTGTVVAQVKSNASHLGRLEVTRTADGFSITGRAFPVDALRTMPVSADVEAVIARYRPEIEEVMEERLGESKFALTRAHRVSPDSRLGWHPRGNALGVWIAQEMARVAGTTIGLHNRGGVRADLPVGAITARDLYQISPFGNSVALCTMSGAHLREVIETSLADHKVRVDVFGLEIGWTHGETFGPSKRLLSLEVGGIAIDDAATYQVATNDYLANGGDGWTQFQAGTVKGTGIEVYEATVMAMRAEDAADRIDSALAAKTYVQVGTGSERALSLFGLFVMLLIAWGLSTSRKSVPWRVVIWGVGLQGLLAALILRTGPGRRIFDGAKEGFNLLLQFSAEGAQFVFGPLADQVAAGQVFGPDKGFLFAFQVAGTIILVSSLTAMLYHIGIMQILVYLLAKVMQLTMRTSGAESLAAAANIFVGQTEAPLVVRPYLSKLTRSETMSLMTGGMATVAGGVLAAYVGFGIDGGHLLAASVMSAPAALAIAKVMVPEQEHPTTAADVPFEIQRVDHNVLDAACRGASDGLKLSINVMAMLIAFTALVALVNWGIGAVHTWFLPAEVVTDAERLLEERWTLQKILGVVFAPLAWVMGAPAGECLQVGTLLGIKMTLNEFYGYIQLSTMREEISPRSVTLATYALCGFANFASIAIQIGGISALEKGLRPTLAKYGPRAMIGGTLAALMTACVAGVMT